MGGCTSQNKNTIHPLKENNIQIKSSKTIYCKEIDSNEKLAMDNLDNLHSQVNNVIDDFEQAKETFHTKLESILEQNFIFNQFYSKIKLLKTICKEQNIQQLEILIEAVHKILQKLPKIEGNINSVKEKLQIEQTKQESPLTNQIKYKMQYKIDQIHFDDFANEIAEWDSILKKYINITYKDIKNKKRLSNESCFQPSTTLTQSQQSKRKTVIIQQKNQNQLFQSQGYLPQNQTLSTLNQSQHNL
ncbi:hypothetical protein TTHERM_00756400 (macronuclear) [Tetrahymena thermophila SB210]|uniref:Uncharacterized protein n=1 Tax=Tetrahymena thermophila (strain SB210) TaxID=312017 RepID=I7M628_TETTS|nr:hypothetical protein TTHERM_00756400 [Tetrahymena thermophila SB210]EAR84092.3 hypothetical protein TTHERM_00756400 [Tetrahymena thermophila SB210]|eukprot:XP_001031755.3 hypothetical protein TTHERM_00756400 [Tetrahymena thermophila SB210]